MDYLSATWAGTHSTNIVGVCLSLLRLAILPGALHTVGPRSPCIGLSNKVNRKRQFRTTDNTGSHCTPSGRFCYNNDYPNNYHNNNYYNGPAYQHIAYLCF